MSSGTGAGRKVLQLAVAIEIADDNIELAVGTEGHRAAIVIRSRCNRQTDNQRWID